MLVEKILINEADMEGDGDLSFWLGASDFHRWLIEAAHLEPGEFPELLHCFDKVSYYGQQVDNGGHEQFAKNTGWQPALNARIRAGLMEVATRDHLDIFEEFSRIMETKSPMRSAILSKRAFAAPKKVKALDSRFFRLGGHEGIMRLGDEWLQSSSLVLVLPRDELDRQKALILKAHTSLESRRAARAAAREAALAADPMHIAARALCAMHGITFEGFTTGNRTARHDTMQWGTRTSGGMFWMQLGPEQAELLDWDSKTVLQTFTPKKGLD